MKTTTVLIQLPDGSYARRTRAELRDTDVVVIDGPSAQADLDEARARLDAEVAAAGGLEKWMLSAGPGQD